MEMFLVLFCFQGDDFGGWRDFFSLFYDNASLFSMILSSYFQAISNAGPGYLTGQLRQEK